MTRVRRLGIDRKRRSSHQTQILTEGGHGEQGLSCLIWICAAEVVFVFDILLIWEEVAEGRRPRLRSERALY